MSTGRSSGRFRRAYSYRSSPSILPSRPVQMPASGSYRAYRHERPHRARRFGRSKFGIGNRAIRAFVDLLAVSWIIRENPALLRRGGGRRCGRASHALDSVIIRKSPPPRLRKFDSWALRSSAKGLGRNLDAVVSEYLWAPLRGPIQVKSPAVSSAWARPPYGGGAARRAHFVNPALRMISSQ